MKIRARTCTYIRAWGVKLCTCNKMCYMYISIFVFQNFHRTNCIYQIFLEFWCWNFENAQKIYFCGDMKSDSQNNFQKSLLNPTSYGISDLGVALKTLPSHNNERVLFDPILTICYRGHLVVACQNSKVSNEKGIGFRVVHVDWHLYNNLFYSSDGKE